MAVKLLMNQSPVSNKASRVSKFLAACGTVAFIVILSEMKPMMISPELRRDDSNTFEMFCLQNISIEPGYYYWFFSESINWHSLYDEIFPILHGNLSQNSGFLSVRIVH